MFFKLLFHKHLEKVDVPTLWRWAKGIGVVGVILWLVPDCIPFIDEITITWLAVSVLWELNARGEINTRWLPESVRKRIGKDRKNVIDVKSEDQT